MTVLLDNYIRSYDTTVDAWKKRSDAADFALYLAGEFKLNPKAVVVDKDGTNYRVFIPLVAGYWCPPDNHAATWLEHYHAFDKKVKKWLSE
jgi:outer membrane protease